MVMNEPGLPVNGSMTELQIIVKPVIRSEFVSACEYSLMYCWFRWHFKRNYNCISEETQVLDLNNIQFVFKKQVTSL